SICRVEVAHARRVIAGCGPFGASQPAGVPSARPEWALCTTIRRARRTMPRSTTSTPASAIVCAARAALPAGSPTASSSSSPSRAIDSMFADLRQRLERIEAVLELRERLERVEVAIVERMRTVREQAPSHLEERLSRLEELAGELAHLVRRPHEEAPAPAPVE